MFLHSKENRSIHSFTPWRGSSTPTLFLMTFLRAIVILLPRSPEAIGSIFSPRTVRRLTDNLQPLIACLHPSCLATNSLPLSFLRFFFFCWPNCTLFSLLFSCRWYGRLF